MDREAIERAGRPVAAGLVILLTLLFLLGTAIRDPRPHDIPVGIAAPPPVAEQLTQAFGQRAPGAFAFTTYASEADARAAIDRRDVVAALVVGPAGPRLVVAGAAGDAIAGGVTAAFSAAFQAQGTTLTHEVVHPFASGDAHGIVLFFLVLATLIASAIAGALTGLSGPRSWLGRAATLVSFAVAAGVIGVTTAAWLSDGYGNGIWTAMAIVALAALAIASVVAASARIIGPAGVALAVLVVVLLGVVSSGGPLGSAFLPDAYRTVAPWLPVEPAYSALRGGLFFDGAGITTSILVLVAWSLAGLIALAAPAIVRAPRTRAAVAAA